MSDFLGYILKQVALQEVTPLVLKSQNQIRHPTSYISDQTFYSFTPVVTFGASLVQELISNFF